MIVELLRPGLVHVDGTPFAASAIEVSDGWIHWTFPARRPDAVEILVLRDAEAPESVSVALQLGEDELTVWHGRLTKIVLPSGVSADERLAAAVFGVATEEWTQRDRQPRSARELLHALLRVSFLPLAHAPEVYR